MFGLRSVSGGLRLGRATRRIVIPIGQQAYTTPGTYSWVAPAGVTSVSVVAVGAGSSNGIQAGAGGGLGWKNNISVTPGNSYTVVVGGSGTDSYFINTSTVAGKGPTGVNFEIGGTYVGDGGGDGGDAGYVINVSSTLGGGGAGGYTGKGGKGAYQSSGLIAATNGQGGGGGGGGNGAGYTGHGAGGGVGLLGQGANGAAAAAGYSSGTYPGDGAAYGGGGGSGGTAATDSYAAWDESNAATNIINSNAGNYGGGSGYSYSGTTGTKSTGAVRIIWGSNRSFPSTNTGNL